MSDTKYNGWANKETWYTALWLGNDEGMDCECRELAENALRATDEDETLDTRKTEAAYEAAKGIEALVSDLCEDQRFGLFNDLLSYAMARIDWEEIAGHYVEDAADNLD